MAASLRQFRWILPDSDVSDGNLAQKQAAAAQESPLASSQILNLSSNLKIQPLLAAILFNRGWDSPSKAKGFLQTSAQDLHDPGLLPDMEPAVDLIIATIKQADPILIHGDYDVDGVAATALLYRALTALGAKVGIFLPHRITEGYGVNRGAIEKAAADGFKLIITADCGSGSPVEIAYAKSLGLQVVITDHHRLSQDDTNGDKKATLEINPQRADSQYPFAELSGVGVAFKLVEALAARLGMPPQSHWRFLDLVALGTVADVSPLLDENRVLVQEGLERIGQTQKQGLRALMKAAGLSAPISSRQVAFMLAPRLNAAGRISHAEESFRLLTTTDSQEADSLAETLCQHNRNRQAEELKTLQQAQEMITELELAQDKALLLLGEGWHPGVIGIVASRLVEIYHRPVFLATHSAEERPEKPGAVGSARSVEGFHLWEALHHCGHLLLRYGGHDQAAGFSVLPENVSILREKLCGLAGDWLNDETTLPCLKIDARVRLADLTLPAVEELQLLEPTGEGNPQPLIFVKDLILQEMTAVGETKNHLRLTLKEQNGPQVRAIWFRQAALAEKLEIGQEVEVCLNPMVATWNGRTAVEFRLKDVAPTEL